MVGAGDVVRIRRFPRLEVNVRVLRRAAKHRPIRRERPHPVRFHQVLLDHRPQIIGRQLLDFGHFVGGAETVEEMQERDARFQAGRRGDQRHVHHFLDRVRRQHAETRGPRRHHVAVVPENRQRMRRQRPRRDVKHRRGQFPGDLVHVRNHQQQALRCRERGRERTALQSPVAGARRAPLALHLDHRRHGAPNVGLAFGSPLIRPLAHVRGRCNRINSDDFVDLMGYVSGCLVAVNGDFRASGGG